MNTCLLSALVEKGIISGNENKMFYPEKPITSTEAASIILNAIGYKPICQLSAWPSGYTKAANDVELLKGVEGGNEISFFDAIVMLYNSLYVYMPNVSFNGAQISGDEDTFISAYCSIYFDRGLLTAYNESSIYGDVIGKNEAKIGDMHFDHSAVDVTDYLGKDVKYFYYENDDERTLLWVYDTGKSEETILEYIEDDVSFDAQNNRFEYADGNRTKYVNIADNKSVLYNGEYLMNDINGKLSEPWHKIRLISTSGNSECDVIIVEAYENYTLSSKDIDNEILYLQTCDNSVANVAPTVINLDDYENVYIELPNGTAGEISKIDRYALVSVMDTPNKTFIKIFVNANPISGKVTGSSTENGYQTIEIDEKEYSTYRKNCVFDISMSQTVSLLIDKYGYIAGVENERGDVSFGYLIKAYRDDGLDDTILVRIFTDRGEKVLLPIYNKVRIDGVRPQDDDAAFNILNNNSPEFIAYTINKDEKITKIDFPQDGGEPTANNMLIKQESLASAKYIPMGRNLMSAKIRLGSNTVIMGVPDDVNDHSQDELYSVIKLSGLFAEQTYINVSGYSYGELGEYIDFVVAKNSPLVGVKATSALRIMIDDICQVWDENLEEVVYQISGYQGNSYVSIKAYEDFGYKEGDLINMAHLRNGVLANRVRQNKMIWSKDNAVNRVIPSLSKDFTASGQRDVGGYVHNVIGNSIFVGYDSGEDFDEIIGASNIPIVVYDTAENEIRKGSLSDIKTYEAAGNQCSLIYIHMTNLMIDQIVIYNY